MAAKRNNRDKKQMDLVYKKVSSLIPYARNSRTHSDEQISQVMASIKEFGWTNPVLIDEDGGIIAGHGRIMAAQRLGMEEVPCIVLEGLTEAQKKAYIIADNKLALNAGWDEDMLKVELQELCEEGYSLDLTGFDMEELDDLGIGDMDIPDLDESKADEVPELEEDPVIKRGDLIELGNHRLLCGDSTDENDVARLMDGKKADMVFTDPPYGVNYTNNMNDKFDAIKNDDVFLDGWIPLVQKHSRGFVFMWTSYQVISKWLEITKPFGRLSNMIVWHKGGGGLGDLKGSFATDYELALVWNRKAELKGKRIGSVWSINKDNGASYVHPTQKPVELTEKGIFNCSFAKSIVMDLFLGSGSTLIACENLNRKCYGMELDEKYAQVITQRWCDYTSIDTIKINGEEVSWNEYKNSVD
jgi:DNA modification methylase